MERVLVTGNSGSGKSTFAVALGSRLGIPVIHLDLLHWAPDGSRVPADEFHRRVAEAVQQDAWIFEGFNIETFHLRASRADTLIFLDLPRWLCVWRLIRPRRRLGVHPGHRIPPRERVRFLRWVWIFPKDRRPGLVADLERYAREKAIVYLRSRAQVRAFLRA